MEKKFSQHAYGAFFADVAVDGERARKRWAE
jgi:hypothetical protein